MRYRRGTSRYQQSFLSLDNQISLKNVVRSIDNICEEYIVQEIEAVFGKGGKETGRKAYHPADLLKILVYGYFNGLSSSRKMERECGRNIELKWLTSDLVPDHKTISDFRKDNPEMIKGLFKYLIRIFKEQGLVTGKGIAVDGSKIKAYAIQEIDVASIEHKLENIEEQVQRYLEQMAAMDQSEDELEEISKVKASMAKDIERMKEEFSKYEEHLEDLKNNGEKKICTTDPEAKVMRGRYGKYWGYNVQTAVDTENHLITKIKVTDNQNDKGLLTQMIKESEEICGHKTEEALADGGYYKINEVENLEKKGTKCYVAINRTCSQARDEANGIAFTYNKEEDQYYCNQGKELKYARKKVIDGKEVRVYKGMECGGCLMKNICTKGEQRMVHRNMNQEWIDSYHKKMQSEEGKIKLAKRKSIVEHPFGSMKYDMGQIPILLRGKSKVQSEMNLYAIGYNLKRYFKIRAEKGQKWSDKKIRQAA